MKEAPVDDRSRTDKRFRIALVHKDVLEFGDTLQVKICRDLQTITRLPNGKLISCLWLQDLYLMRLYNCSFRFFRSRAHRSGPASGFKTRSNLLANGVSSTDSNQTTS